MSGSINGVFQDDLSKEEKILWTGQPVFRVFSSKDIFLVPFSIMWGGFAIFWELGVLSTIRNVNTKDNPIGLLFPLWGIPFVIIGLYFMFGRFFVKKWKASNTYYAVTNKRILILTHLFDRNLQSAYIDQLPSINQTIRSDGSGTIQFGNLPFSAFYANTGMDFFGSLSTRSIETAFYDIKDVKKVYELVTALKENKAPENS